MSVSTFTGESKGEMDVTLPSSQWSATPVDVQLARTWERHVTLRLIPR